MITSAQLTQEPSSFTDSQTMDEMNKTHIYTNVQKQDDQFRNTFQRTIDYS